MFATCSLFQYIEVKLCLALTLLFARFYRWKVTAGDKATPKALKKALVDMKLMAIVHKYFAAA